MYATPQVVLSDAFERVVLQHRNLANRRSHSPFLTPITEPVGVKP